jgi:hypothetical protein
MKENEFIPISFGEQKGKAKVCIDSWEDLIEDANEFYQEIMLFFDNEKDEDDLTRFLEFHKLKDSDTDFIVKLFEARNTTPTVEFNYRKMASAGMLLFSPDLLNSRRNYQESLSKVSGFGFRFNLMDCYCDGVFYLPSNFKEMVTDHYTFRTKNQVENEVVEIANSIKEGLNTLIERGYLKSPLGTVGLFTKAANFFNYNPNEKERPITVTNKLVQLVRSREAENEDPDE